MPTPSAPTFNSLLTNINPTGVGTAPLTNTTTPVDTRLNALVATDTPPQSAGAKTVPVITPAPAIQHYNQTLNKVNTVTQQAQQKAALNQQQPNYPAGNVAAAQQLNNPPPKTPPTPTPPQTPTTGNPTADQSIAGVNGVTAPTAPKLTDSFGNPLTVPAGLTGGDEAKYIQTYNENQQQYKADMGQIQDTLGKILNGTFVTAAQQAQIDSTRQLFENTAQLLDAANERSTASDITLGLQSGESMKTIANQAKDETLQLSFALSNNTARMTQTISQLQQAFEKDDLDAVNALSKSLTDGYTAQANFLDKMISTAQDAQDKVNTYNLNLAKDISDAKEKQFQDAMAVSNFSLDQANKAFQDYIAQGDLTEKQKQDAETVLHDRISEGIAAASKNIEQEKLDFETGKTTYAAYVAEGAKIPGVVTDNTLGIRYFDPNQIADPTQKQAAENAARAAGIPIIDPENVKTIQSITSAASSLSDFKQAFQQLTAPPTPGLTPAQEALERQSRETQFKSMDDTIGGLLKSVGQDSPAAGFLKAAQDALPSFGVFGFGVRTEGPAVAQTQFNTVQQNLTNALTSILPGIQYSTVSNYITANPINGPKIMQQFQQQFPGATPDDFLQVINSNQ